MSCSKGRLAVKARGRVSTRIRPGKSIIAPFMTAMHKRSNWLFAGSLRAGQRAAAIMSLIQSAKLNVHDPYRYLKDELERLPTQPASRIEELLPHIWRSVQE